MYIRSVKYHNLNNGCNKYFVEKIALNTQYHNVGWAMVLQLIVLTSNVIKARILARLEKEPSSSSEWELPVF